MRSLLLASFLGAFLFASQAFAETKFNLFKVEKPLENYHSSQLDARLQSAMRDLLVRVVGGEEILQTAEAQNYIKSARSWVKNFSFDNREADGVVIGQKLVVEFDQARLLNQFQADGIAIWPLSHRPKTLLLGSWSQQGLTANLTAETLDYRIDLDPRDYANLLALEMDLPATEQEFSEVFSAQMLSATNLENYQDESFANYDYLLVFSSNVVGKTVDLQAKLFDLKTLKLVKNLSSTADEFSLAIEQTLGEVLAFYSKPYRDGANDFAVFQLKVENLPSYSAFESLEKFLVSLKPAFREVKLIKIQSSTAYFDIYYQGDYQDSLRLLKRTPHLELLEESRFSGEILARHK